MNRALLSAGAVLGVLAAGAGIGAITSPDAGRADGQSGDRWVPVQNTVAVCPDPVSDGVSRSSVAAFAPTGDGAPGDGGEATLFDLGDAGKVRQRVDKAGTQVVLPVAGLDLPPLVGHARGTVAPGFTLQQSTTTPSGTRRGLSSVACAAPGTGFWFVGTSSSANRRTSLLLTNSEPVPATVDVFLYGPKGPIEAPGGRNLIVAAGKQREVLLGALAAGVSDLGVNVLVRSGRVSAALRDYAVVGRNPRGIDWLQAAGQPAKRVVVPAAPPGSTAILFLLAPGEDDGTVQIKLVAKDGSFTPVGADSVQVQGGKVTSVDVGKASPREAAAVLISSEVPVLAGMRVIRTASRRTPDVAYLAASTPLVNGAVIAESRNGSGASAKLYLTAPGREARATVTTVAAGTPQRQSVVVPAGTTLAMTPRPPARGSGYAVLVTPEPGSGELYGSWAQFVKSAEGELFTAQPLVDDRATVLVPRVGHDLSAGISRDR